MTNKIRTLDELKEIRDYSRENKYFIGTTSGRFGPFHLGHGYMLRAAKLLIQTESEEKSKEGGVLIVLLNSDASIEKLNGSPRLYTSQGERAETLSLLECVDYITLFNEDTPLRYIEELKPDIHIKGRGKSIVPERVAEERRLVESWGGNHVLLSLLEGYSTARIIERFQNLK